MSLPQVSIIVPVYNVERYLPTCLESLLNQSLHNIEIIAVNDGSTDRSGAILEEYAQKDSRIRMFQQENQGPSVARNLGLTHARAPYLSFVDSDDWVEPDTYKVVLNAIKNDIDFVVWGTTIWTSNIKKTQFRPVSSMAEVLLSPSHKRNFSNVVWSKLYRTDIIQDHHLFFPEKIRQFEDFVFNAKYFAWAKKGLLLPHYLYNSRSDREGSIMTTFSQSIKLPVYTIGFQAFEEIASYYKKNNLLNTDYLKYLSEILATSLGSGLWFSSDKDAFLEVAREFVKRFKLPDTDRNTFKDLLSAKGYARFDPVSPIENILSLRNIGNKKILRVFGIDFAFKRKR